MAYGEIKVDTVTFTDGGIDKSVSISGLVQNPTFSGNITVTGTISGNTVQGQTVSGATVTGTTANFVSGVFTTQISGATITGNVGSFTTITGGTVTLTSGVFASGTAAAPSVSIGTTDNGLYSPGADQVAVATNGTGRLFVDALGNVGASATPSAWNASWKVLEFANGHAFGSSGVQSAIAQNLFNNSGNSWIYKTSAAATFYQQNNGEYIWYTAASGTAGNTASLSERMRLTSAGLVGIGTSSPVSTLDAAGDISITGNENYLYLYSTALVGSNARARIRAVGSGGGSGYGGDFRVSTRKQDNTWNTDAFVVDSSGNVGIGTTAPQYPLHVETTGTGTAAGDNTSIIVQSQASGRDCNIRFGDSINASARIGYLSNNLYFYVNGTERARIDSSGRLLVGTSSARSGGPYGTAGLQVESTSFQNASISAINNENTADGVALMLGKSRGSSIGSTTIVSSGDQIGGVYFQGADGSALRPAASIFAEVDGTPGANDMPGRLIFATTADGAASPTERMRITSGGNVGIGTTSPAPGGQGVHIHNPSAAASSLRVTNSTTGATDGDGFAIQVGSDGTAQLRQFESLALTFETAATERARIDSSGRLLVGTSTARTYTTGGAGGNHKLQLETAGATSVFTTAGIYSNSDVAGLGAYLELGRSKGTTLGAVTAVAQDDVLGEIRFAGTNGTGANSAASIAGYVDGAVSGGGASDMPGRLVFSTTADGASSPTERLRIDSSGRVGIGTVSPTRLLTVQSTGNANLCIKTTNTGVSQCMFGDTDSDVAGNIAYLHSADAMTFETLGTERARIDSSGRLLVGTSTSRAVQDFTGNGPESLIQIEATNSNAIMSIISAGTADAGRAGTLSLGRHRNATVGGTPTIVQSGDTIGAICFAGGDGTDMLTKGAAIACQVDGTPGADDMPGRLVFSTTADGASSPTERLRITSAGLVGIGTSTPQLSIGAVGGTVLHLAGAGTTGVRVQNTSGNSVDIYAGTDGFINQSGSGTLNFQLAGSTKATLTSTGLGIGTTSVSAGLHVVTDVNPVLKLDRGTANPANANLYYNGTLTAQISAANQNFQISAAGASTPMSFYVNGSERFKCDTSGRLLVGTSTWSGDERVVIYNNPSSSGPGYLGLATGTASPANGINLGAVIYAASDGGNIAAIRVKRDGGSWTNGTSTPTRLEFSTTADGASSPTERMRIAAIGDIGVSNANHFYPTTDNVTSIGLSGLRWTAIWAANGTIQTSDERAKINIADATLGSDFIRSLRPVSYKWIEGGKRDTGERDKDNNYVYESVPGQRTHWGFIAQEVKQAVDDAGVDFGGWVLTDKDDPNSQQALRYDQFIAPLTKALQETMAELEALKAEVAALKAP
jgi:hypothetical protein